MLDGEGGFCVWGRQMPAERSLADGLLPLGLAHDVRSRATSPRRVPRMVPMSRYDPDDLAVRVRREMEAAFGRANRADRPMNPRRSGVRLPA